MRSQIRNQIHLKRDGSPLLWVKEIPVVSKYDCNSQVLLRWTQFFFCLSSYGKNYSNYQSCSKILGGIRFCDTDSLKSVCQCLKFWIRRCFSRLKCKATNLSFLLCNVSSNVLVYIFICAYAVQCTQKKDKDRRNGKGRRFYLEARIDSIPCRASCFSLDDLNYRMNYQDDLKEKDEFSLFDKIVVGKIASAARN